MTELHDRPTQGRSPGDLPSLVGRRIGLYDIVEEVGRGGMGVVYRARDKSLDRDVAVKVLLPHLATDPEFEKRFVREARAAAKLDHPAIVQTYTAGRSDGLLFIAMQFVRGRTLQEVLRERGSLPAPEALRIVRQVAEALRAAHAGGLVHRDIKPNNVMIDESGRVKVMDFGLMRSRSARDNITQSGVFFGTPEYSSPEQCETRDIDGRSDIYSLGAVLYEMLTGRIPHVAETPLALFKKISEESPEPVRSLAPDVPRAVERIVAKMMAKRRDDRYADCAELVADLDAAQRPEGTPLAAPGPGVGWAWPVGAAVLATLLIALLAFFFLRDAAPPAAAGGGETVAVAPAAKTRLVVFDFRNGFGNEEAAWYEIAISDLLIASLAQREGFDVPTRDELVWKVRNLSLGERVTDENQRRLIEELGAKLYVSGQYYVRGGRLRVTVAAYHADDHRVAFGPASYERGEGEVFGLVDDVARGLAIGLRSTGPDSAAAGDRPVESCGKLALAALRSREEPSDERARQKEPASPPPPSESAPDARREPVEALKKEGAWNFGGLSDVETAKQWYANRRLAEQCGVDREELRVLVDNLRAQFKAEEPDAARLQQGLQVFQRCVERLGEEARKGARHAGLRVVYVCPACVGAPSASPGTCAGCSGPLVVAVNLEFHKDASKKDGMK